MHSSTCSFCQASRLVLSGRIAGALKADANALAELTDIHADTERFNLLDQFPKNIATKMWHTNQPVFDAGIRQQTSQQWRIINAQDN